MSKSKSNHQQENSHIRSFWFTDLKATQYAQRLKFEPKNIAEYAKKFLSIVRCGGYATTLCRIRDEGTNQSQYFAKDPENGEVFEI
jgi:hypothetical protein